MVRKSTNVRRVGAEIMMIRLKLKFLTPESFTFWPRKLQRPGLGVDPSWELETMELLPLWDASSPYAIRIMPSHLPWPASGFPFRSSSTVRLSVTSFIPRQESLDAQFQSGIPLVHSYLLKASKSTTKEHRRRNVHFQGCRRSYLWLVHMLSEDKTNEVKLLSTTRYRPIVSKAPVSNNRFHIFTDREVNYPKHLPTR
jgi:hypothetical protein